ncbi:MAG: hypothetical protein IT385_07210 [Deltaproteobacteria bacterium]|nr:hypothetical protein [Deltaproteobacteria bacterium]
MAPDLQFKPALHGSRRSWPARRPGLRPAWTLTTPSRALAALAICALGACVERAPDDPSNGQAVRLVREVERGLSRGDHGPALAAVDFEYRLAEVLPDLWPSGTAEERADLVALGSAMFEDTTARYWDMCCAGRDLVPRVARRQGEHVWVRSDAVGGPNGFRWLYRLTKRGDGWRITQREFQDDHVLRSDSTRFWPMALKKITSRFGRPPTLRELIANLPGVMGTIKARVIKVPDLSGRGSQ